MGILSGLLGGALGLLGSAKDDKNQKEAAKKSIRWRVNDAKLAGVSPVFALGAPTMNFQSTYGAVGAQAGSDIGSGFEQMGQNITRARAAGMDAPEREAAGVMLKLQLERGGLENELLRRQIMQIRAPGVPGQQPKPIIPGQAPRDPDATPMGIVLPDGTIFETGASSPSNTVEQQYGDVVQNVHGVGRLLWDGTTNLQRWIAPYDYSARRPAKNRGYPRYGGIR